MIFPEKEPHPLANEAVNRAGMSFFFRAMEETKASAADVLRAYVTVREVFGLAELWQSVDALESVPAEAQTAAYLDVRELLDWAVRWVLASRRLPIDVASEVRRLRPAVAQLLAGVGSRVGSEEAKRLVDVATLVELGLPPELAERITHVKYAFGLLDIVEVATANSMGLGEVAAVYLALSDRWRAGALRGLISALPHDDHWQARARMTLHTQLYAALAAVTAEVVTSTDPAAPAWNRVLEWERANARTLDRAWKQLGDLT